MNLMHTHTHTKTLDFWLCREQSRDLHAHRTRQQTARGLRGCLALTSIRNIAIALPQLIRRHRTTTPSTASSTHTHKTRGAPHHNNTTTTTHSNKQFSSGALCVLWSFEPERRGFNRHGCSSSPSRRPSPLCRDVFRARARISAFCGLERLLCVRTFFWSSSFRGAFAGKDG